MASREHCSTIFVMQITNIFVISNKFIVTFCTEMLNMLNTYGFFSFFFQKMNNRFLSITTFVVFLIIISRINSAKLSVHSHKTVYLVFFTALDFQIYYKTFQKTIIYFNMNFGEGFLITNRYNFLYPFSISKADFCSIFSRIKQSK